MTPAELDDLVAHLIELVVQVVVLAKIIRHCQEPVVNDLPKRDPPPGL